MRIYKDLGLVEQLGSGVPRILESYSKECFKFSDNFLRMTFPRESQDGGQVGGQIGGQFIDFINEFGSLAIREKTDSVKNKEFLAKRYGVFSEYFRSTFGVTSEKLRKSFGITSERKLPNPVNALFIIALLPEVTAEQIGKILGVSARSAETYIEKLKAEGLIERVGGKKEGAWLIKQLK